MVPLPTTLPLHTIPPRQLATDRPVQVVLVGGFLGAGKTTALRALATPLTKRGLRVGIVTNDQAAHLVDTATVRHDGFVASEVAGGCFCCRFTDLVDAAQQVITAVKPDILLCEPVGSCTDMVATVLAPLRHFYSGSLTLAPFAVLVDPKRVRELILGETPAPLAAEAAYIFHKQIEEADEILLNKVDALAENEAARLASLLTARFDKPVRQVSTVRGDGIAAWADALLGNSGAGRHPLSEIDYDTYAVGEAALGWLNATATLTPATDASSFQPRAFAEALLTTIGAACATPTAQRNAVEIAHVKLALSDDAGTQGKNHFLRANLTTASRQPEWSGDASWQDASQATLILNARVQSTPEWLESTVKEALQDAAARTNTHVQTTTLQCFSPAYPRPPYPPRHDIGAITHRHHSVVTLTGGIARNRSVPTAISPAHVFSRSKAASGSVQK